MVKQVFRVTDMHCSNCVMRIEGLEDDLPGVQRVRASYKKQQVEVEYDEDKVSDRANRRGDPAARLHRRLRVRLNSVADCLCEGRSPKQCAASDGDYFVAG